MAAILRHPWINTLVENELEDAFRSFRSSYSGQPELLKSNRCCRPSGVEIRLSKNRQAQVTDFDGGHTRPYDAILTDGIHSIQAVFDKTSVETFTRDTARHLRDIRGGIIVLQSYHLLVNAAAPSPRLSLKVLCFKLHGSEGSPVIGRPLGILTLQSVQILVEKLQNLLPYSEGDHSTKILSPAGSGGKSSQPSAGFATQVDSIADRRMPTVGMAQESVIRDQDKLAALLGHVSGKPRHLVQINDHNVTEKTALGPVPEKEVGWMNFKLDATANPQGKQSLEPLDSCSSVSVAVSLQGVGNDEPNQDCLLNKGEKENSEECAEDLNIFPHQQPATVVVQHHMPEFDFVDQLQCDDAFDALKRVPRRYVLISKDQKVLLERSDVWHEPKTVGKSAFANIPAKVMKDLTGLRTWRYNEPKHQNRDSLESASERHSAVDSGDDDSGSVDFCRSCVHQDTNENREQSGASSKVVNLSVEDLFPSRGPDIVHEADGSDDHMAEDEPPSWEPTPQPEEEVSQPKSSDGTVEQRPPRSPGDSTLYRMPQGKLYIRSPVEIPSSSPTMEEELELAVPYAIGDIVDPEDLEVEEVISPSQGLPSTAPPTSTYVQVKRTPYMKSRSFDETSLHPSTTVSREARINVSSSPVIPATFHDPSSSEKPASSSIDHITTGPDSIQPATTHSQNITITSSLPHTKKTTIEVETETTSKFHLNGSHYQWAAKAQTSGVDHHSSRQVNGEKHSVHPGHDSLSRKLRATSSEFHGAGNIEYEGEPPKANIAQTKQLGHAVSAETRFTKRRRKMFLLESDAENDLDNRPKDELLLEERRRARDAKRGFKAKEQLIREASEADTGSLKRPHSRAPLPGLSKSEKSCTPEAGSHSEIRILLSPTPNSPVRVGEPEDLQKFGQCSEDEAARKTIRSHNSSPLKSQRIEFHGEPSSLAATVTLDSVGLTTPSTTSYVPRSRRESTRLGSPSSAQAMAEEEAGLPSLQGSLGSVTLSPAQRDHDNDFNPVHGEGKSKPGSLSPQPQAEEDDHQQSLQANIEGSNSSCERSKGVKDAQQSASGPVIQPHRAPRSAGQAVEDHSSKRLGNKSQASEPMPVKRTTSDCHPRITSPVSERQTVRPNTVRQANRNENNQAQHDQQLRDHTFDKFISTYPEYSGDKKCFTRALVCLEWLRKRCSPPWNMCDDFVRAHAEWEPYVRHLKKSNLEQLPTAWEYYDNNVKDVIFDRKFLTDKDKLAAALSSLDPLYVQTIRDAYNAPPALSKSSEGRTSTSDPAKKVVFPTTTATSAAKVNEEERAASPELGSADNISRRRVRDPFFETASQLEDMRQTKRPDAATGSILDPKRSDKRRRFLPWMQSRETLVADASSSRSRLDSSRGEPKPGSGEYKKRRQINEQKLATMPPALRASSFAASSDIFRKELIRPASRGSEVFVMPIAPESIMEVGRISPELPDPTEKWVARQILVDEPQIKEIPTMSRKDAVRGSAARGGDCATPSRTESSMPAKTRRFRDLAEFAKDLGSRRRSGEISSKGSTPCSTPKRFCTKPKGETPAEQAEPDTQAWQY